MTQLAPCSNGYLTIPDPYSEQIRTCPSCGEDYQPDNWRSRCACPDLEESP